jgi:hypothetical protein
MIGTGSPSGGCRATRPANRSGSLHGCGEGSGVGRQFSRRREVQIVFAPFAWIAFTAAVFSVLLLPLIA